jgi:nucleotide-binding universal stress UspA family protein
MEEHTVGTCPLTKGEHMLVAVDGSKCSEHAVDQAVSLGRMCNSKIYLVSVVDIHPDNISDAPYLVDKLTEQAQEYLEKAKKKVEAASIDCETIVHTGNKPHEHIIDDAKKNKVDLIVLGTHGRTGMKQILLGSVAQKVVGLAPCPIMIIPQSFEY